MQCSQFGRLYVCMYVCTCMCVCIYVCMCVYVCMYTYVCIMYVCVCMYVCMYVCHVYKTEKSLKMKRDVGMAAKKYTNKEGYKCEGKNVCVLFGSHSYISSHFQ